MKDKTEQNRHNNLLKFVHSALLAYSVFAVFLITAKLTIETEIKFIFIVIYIVFYLTAVSIFYILINKRYYLKVASDKNFFIVPSLVGLVLGQYYFFILGKARWLYILVLAISYLGVTYQNYKVVLSVSLSSATANLIIVGFIHITKLQGTNLAADLLVVATHYILAFFMIPITRFFNVISDSYREILHVLRDRNHIIEKDLELAYTIQKSLLPAEYPRYPGLQFASKYIPMDVVGGDFYDFIQIDEKEAGIFISDVSGHGVPAALITSMVKIAVSSLNKRVISKPSKFFQVINEALIDKTATNFITAFYCIYNSETKILRYSNAGHCQPILYRKSTGDMYSLATDGIILGIFNGVNIEEKSIQIEAGDRLILYTDGLVETINPQREFYGVNGLKNFIKKNQDAPITEFVHCLFDDVNSWSKIKNFEDDIVIIGVDFTEGKNVKEEIKKLTSDTEIHQSAEIIRSAFEEITNKFQITRENFPSYAAFTTPDKLKGFKAKGGEMYGLFTDNLQVGFVAIEEAKDNVYYLMKLAILPEYRHRKYGEKLMNYVYDVIKQRNGKAISMAVLEDAITLKDWYSRMGFVEIRKEKFPNIPYQVCFMEKKL